MMKPCSEALIDSELRKLREVRVGLNECLAVLLDDDVGRPEMNATLSFIQMAIEALSRFQAKRAASE
jgi:hypothetical protein